MRRRTFVWALGAALAAPLRAADAQRQVFDLFTEIAKALSEGEPHVFLEAVDPAMPHVHDLQDNLRALTDQADVTNSIEVYSDEGDDTHRMEELDWFMEIVGRSESHTVERRRQIVKFKLEKRGKKWKIVSIDPISIFAPPKGAS